ncbi:MAG: YbhB/YbcL family Raf kinase inhibitor-like protein [Actinobacteria bacterium]|nr:YbhB/YbcL family Raf kinase inhibitor-like protein [Actinomycetota bacterium]
MMRLTSETFPDGGRIPRESACTAKGGGNLSPQVSWQGQPDGTGSFALVMDDENPPCGSGDDACVHWALFNIPASVKGLREGQGAEEIKATEGLTYNGQAGYAGPCPPRPHSYKLTVFALRPGAAAVPGGIRLTRSSFASRYAEEILDHATIEATFSP